MISNKDQKVLWARAAGRCSMPECRKKLTLNKVDENESITLGEMCHIVGEKDSEDSPRGKSKMALEDRDTYSNLILLCAYHHTIIDKNEKAWPIEILHKIKDEHEQWIEESLESNKLAPDELLYSETIDLLTSVLQLEKWDWFIDNAVRQLVHRDFIYAGDTIQERLLAIDWPTTKPELENAIKSMMQSYLNYIFQFLDGAAPRERGDFFGPNNAFKSIFLNPDYYYESSKQDLWARKNFLLLCIYTVKLNKYLKKVRDLINPYYFNIRGRFLIEDTFGTHLGNWGTLMDPASITNFENRLKEIDDQMIILEKVHHAT
jgi:hypothetical protein